MIERKAEIPDPNRAGLSAEELRLLGSYANGPRIWDATAVFAIVLQLEDKGLLAPVLGGSPGAYAITAQGRAELL